MPRISKAEQKKLYAAIEQDISLQRKPFTTYEIAKHFITDKTLYKTFFAINHHVSRVILIMESSGKIKFLEEVESMAPVKKRLYEVIK